MADRMKLTIYKARWFLLAAVLGLAVLIPATTSSAHTGTAPTISCTEVSSSFSSFPAGTHTITFTIVVNGVTSTKTGTFSGASGTVTIDISDLTTATGPLAITAKATWTDDGGGTTATSEKATVCHEKPPEPPTPEPTPTPQVIVLPAIRFTG